MSAYGGRRTIGWVFLRRLRILGLFVLVVLVGLGVWNVYRKDQESIALRNQAQGSLADLEARETNLKNNMANLDTDRGMEEALREQYALAGKGEGLITIVDQEPSSTSLTASQHKAWWQYLMFW